MEISLDEESEADAARSIGDQHDAATVLFADIVSFTEIARRMSADSLVLLLNDIFTEFDDLAQEYGLEKIKTIGDAYMVVGGLPEAQSDHAGRIARDAVAIATTRGCPSAFASASIRGPSWPVSSASTNSPMIYGATP